MRTCSRSPGDTGTRLVTFDAAAVKLAVGDEVELLTALG